MKKRTCIPFFGKRAGQLLRLAAEVARRPLAYGETHQQRQDAADGLTKQAEESIESRREAHAERFTDGRPKLYWRDSQGNRCIAPLFGDPCYGSVGPGMVQYPAVGDDARVIQAGRTGSEFQRKEPRKGARSRAKRATAAQRIDAAWAIRWAHLSRAQKAELARNGIHTVSQLREREAGKEVTRGKVGGPFGRYLTGKQKRDHRLAVRSVTRALERGRAIHQAALG